ncbi:hypothetical protein RhiirA5_437279 [Rhizophagus irregularis]|uniref:Uncharacterized protein n=1 Tax=Rhizophagus irregularis TaxID=588596 RepID=A0A2N0NKR4_9GLOM|nr:hypothetical protein RhiirA5_437279 [Rhizophagus irregularis]
MYMIIKDEQYLEATDSLTGSMIPSNVLVNDFNKLNAEFSDRIKDINVSVEGSKGKGKVVESEIEELNENKKRGLKTHGSKEDSDSD